MDKETLLRTQIKNALMRVTKGNSPEIYRRIANKEGYLRIENMILNRMITSVQTADAIVPQLESEFNEE